VAILVDEKFIMTPDGEITMSFTEDHLAEAKACSKQKETTKGWTQDRGMRQCLRIPPRLYQDWCNRLGRECWQDNDFLKFISKAHPELTI